MADLMQNTPRSHGIMNAESPTRLTTDAGITAAINELTLAKPYLGRQRDWATIADAPADYRDDLDELVEAVQLAKMNPRLSDEAKWSDIDGITRAWLPEAERLVQSLEDAAARWERELTDAARPPAPTTDEILLEAKLANARSDAVLVLDRATTDEDVADRLAEMATGADPALSYLVLGTSWIATYFRSRGTNMAALLWEEKKRQVLAEVLTDAALEAHKKIAGVPHARKAAHALRAAHNFFQHDNAELFGGSGA